MVEIIPKPAAKSSVWQSAIFYISFFLLLVVILAYFLLEFYFIKQAEGNLGELERIISERGTAEEVSLENKILICQRKIKDFSVLMQGHIFSSKFFEFIEENTHPEVWFLNLDLNPETGVANLNGRAGNFVVLSQQLQIFKSNPLVKTCDLTAMNINKEGGVDFSLSFNLNPNLFILK